jgi:hypothetical protein
VPSICKRLTSEISLDSGRRTSVFAAGSRFVWALGFLRLLEFSRIIATYCEM